MGTATGCITASPLRQLRDGRKGATNVQPAVPFWQYPELALGVLLACVSEPLMLALALLSAAYCTTLAQATCGAWHLVFILCKVRGGCILNDCQLPLEYCLVSS